MSGPQTAAGVAAGFDEVACLEAIQRGDSRCLGPFFEAWADRLYGLALRLLRDPAAAEDVVQESFVKLIANAERLEGRARLATWLYRVVYNAAIDRLREQKRYVPVPEDGDDAPASAQPSLHVDFRMSPDEMLHDAEMRQALEEAIDALPPTLRAAFLLRDVEGLTTAQAAEALSVSEANLKVRLHRARLALRERLSEFVAARGEGRGKAS
jgi:RNA polymerase sigma-70 factor (ECF subfamily)